MKLPFCYRYTAKLGAFAMATLLLPWGAGLLHAQQVNISSPFNSVGHGFNENIGLNWGLRGPGWFFNFGGGAPGVAPPFGGFDPNAGANGGVGFRAGNVNGFLNFTAGQGANSTFVSQTPNVTVMNGGSGYFIDSSFRPFVTGVVPVVGQQFDSTPHSPLQDKLRRLESGEVKSPAPDESASSHPAAGGGGGAAARNSSAERGALSVAEIKAHAASIAQSEDKELAVMLEKAQGAEAAGKPGVAKVYYQMAARRATGDRQREILSRLEALPK